jgi:hypothetical protein
MRKLVQSLLRKARNGDVAACKLILEYTLGPPQPLDIIETIAEIEAVVFHAKIAQ